MKEKTFSITWTATLFSFEEEIRSCKQHARTKAELTHLWASKLNVGPSWKYSYGYSISAEITLYMYSTFASSYINFSFRGCFQELALKYNANFYQKILVDKCIVLSRPAKSVYTLAPTKSMSTATLTTFFVLLFPAQ